MSEGVEVELRGILEKISNRFWNGWGFGELSTDQGLIKITGALEGHVAGTSLIVRGSYKESNYGRQLDCSAIVVDSVSGDINVIRAWVRKAFPDSPEIEVQVMRLCRFLDRTERWDILVDAARLRKEGFSAEEAAKVSLHAQGYLRFIELKKGLMEKGFTDREAEHMWECYGEEVLEVLEQDPYSFVIDRIIAFNRIDSVVSERFPRNDEQRLRAAMVQALVGGLKNGHTALEPLAVMAEAAELTGVYVDAVRQVEPPWGTIVQFEGKMQLRAAARAEENIAEWILRAVELEA